MLFKLSFRKGVKMTYQTTAELPKAIKNHLPLHAQEIYMPAFNSAWEEYKDPHKRKDNVSLEETAHKVAWAAVKKKYVKKEEVWERR
jgi:cation transport regulator